MNKSKKNLVYGIGVNDSTTPVYKTVNGKRISCKAYRVWGKMLERCYDPKYHKTHPTYIGCSVCDEWLYFSSFRDWMKQQDWRGKQLDKDILVPDNKIYSPNNCVFVSGAVNTLLTDSKASRGQYPIGVHWKKSKNKFQVQINKYGKQITLGYFHNPEDASACYVKEKAALIQEIADTQTPAIKAGLLLHRGLLLMSS